MLGDEHFTNVILNLNLLLYPIWVLFTTQYRDLTFGVALTINTGYGASGGGTSKTKRGKAQVDLCITGLMDILDK